MTDLYRQHSYNTSAPFGRATDKNHITHKTLVSLPPHGRGQTDIYRALVLQLCRGTFIADAQVQEATTPVTCIQCLSI